MRIRDTISSRQSRSGFTLVELLVVILIIAILSGIVLTAIGAGDEERSVNAGVTRMKSIFSLAQSAALTRKELTRVLIHFDESEPDKFLRYATILYLDEGDVNNPNDDEWKPYIDGEYLPDGVFFSPALSSASGANKPPLFTWTVGIEPNTFEVTPSGTPSAETPYVLGTSGDPLSDGPGADKWYMYQFAKNGTASPPPVNPGDELIHGTRFVIVDGILDATTPQLIIPSEDTDVPYERAKGFVVFRSGKQMFFQSPEQIKEGN